MTEYIDPFEGTEKAATKRSYNPENLTFEEKAKRGIIFEKDNLYGLKDGEGNILFEPKYIFIGKCKDYVLFIEPDWNYCKTSSGCTETGYMREEERPYIVKGKAGIKEGDDVIIPAEYDFISKEFGGDVFLAVKNGKEMYIDQEGKEVLTRVRTFEEECIKGSPFWLRTNSFDYFTLMSYIGTPDDNNPNVVKVCGEWVELDRYSKDEIMNMLIDPKDDLPLTLDNLSLLCNNFSYEYSFYVAKASGKNPLLQCWEQLEKMNAFDNSWYYVVKIWQAPGEQLGAYELRKFESKLKKSEIIGEPIFAIGHSEELKSGEVKMLFITHYHERCWPADFEFEWSDNCQKLNITELAKLVPELKKTIKEDVIDKYIQEVYEDQVRDVIQDMEYYEGMTWETTEPAINYFYQEGSSINCVTVAYLKKALKFYNTNVKAFELYSRGALWALEHGANVNEVVHNHTALDYVNEMLKKRVASTNVEFLQSIKDKLNAKGAKTYQCLKLEREHNQDYYKELDYLRIKGTTNKEMPVLS